MILFNIIRNIFNFSVYVFFTYIVYIVGLISTFYFIVKFFEEVAKEPAKKKRVKKRSPKKRASN